MKSGLGWANSMTRVYSSGAENSTQILLPSSSRVEKSPLGLRYISSCMNTLS